MKNFLKLLNAIFFCILSLSVFADSVVGEWDLAESLGGPAVGKMVISADGSINYDGTIGSWTMSGNHLIAKV